MPRQTTANQNCLKGMRCPECGSYGPFWIDVSMMVLVYDDGFDCEEHEDPSDWQENSACRCQECKAEKTVKDFMWM